MRIVYKYNMMACILFKRKCNDMKYIIKTYDLIK